MTPPRNRNLLINWIFLAGLILLAFNDHYLKYAYPGLFTGKLSDFIGLLIFPLFLAFLFPRQARVMPLLTGLIFLCWKSSSSTPFIALWNRYCPLTLTRTLDKTDLLALVVLPLAYYLIRPVGGDRCMQLIDRYRIRIVPCMQPRSIWLILPASLIFMSTSAPLWYRTKDYPKGDIYIGKRYQLSLTPEQVLAEVQKEGYTPRIDTAYHTDSTSHYIIENIPLPETRDTLRSIQFALKPYEKGSVFVLNNINLKQGINLGDWRLLKHYSRWYKQQVQKYVIQPLH